MPINKSSKYFLLLPGICLAIACNMGNNKNKEKTVKDTGQNDTIRMLKPLPAEGTTSTLFSHFKENTKFPILIDSAYMAHVKGHDSLGTNEVKLLTQKWYDDSLVNDNDYVLKAFYTIDSAKAKHAYDKWAEKLDIGMTALSNAYALQKIKLADGSEMLVWAIEAISYPACPSFDNTQIYFTLFNQNSPGVTFTLGCTFYGADAPMVGQTIVTGKLTADGNLTLDENELEEDVDTTVANVNHAYYEYSIQKNGILLKSKKRDATKEIIVPKQ